jgi:hypothetical protein
VESPYRLQAVSLISRGSKDAAQARRRIDVELQCREDLIPISFCQISKRLAAVAAAPGLGFVGATPFPEGAGRQSHSGPKCGGRINVSNLGAGVDHTDPLPIQLSSNRSSPQFAVPELTHRGRVKLNSSD